MSGSPVNILIIKLGALGDLIMSTALIKRITEHHAADRICLLTSSGYMRILQGWGRLQAEALPGKDVISMIKTIRMIRGRQFRRIYDLQSNDRSAILCALSGVPERVGNHPQFPYNIHPPDKYTGQYHAIDRLNQVLASAGVTPAHDPPYLPISVHGKERVRTWLDDSGLTLRPFVLMHAGAGSHHPEKRWPFFLQLAGELETYGLTTVWLGGPDDVVLNARLATETGINTTGVFSVAEEAELGRYGKFAVTNDSAPMHILSCSGIPVFGLFAATDWRRAHAIGQKDNVICATSPEGGPDRNFTPADIAAISVNMVMGRLAAAGLIPFRGGPRA